MIEVLRASVAKVGVVEEDETLEGLDEPDGHGIGNLNLIHARLNELNHLAWDV